VFLPFLEGEKKCSPSFFDNLVNVGNWQGESAARCTTRVTIDDITAMDGASMTILLTENEDAGRWIWSSATNSGFPVASGNHFPTESDGIDDMETWVGFCYPNIYNNNTFSYGGDGQPSFINEGRATSANPSLNRVELTRPSSGHPGGVVAAFVDGGARFLRDDMDKALFISLARPGSGEIINPKDLFD